jgi:uncharacterized protein (TIGR03066 family)
VGHHNKLPLKSKQTTTGPARNDRGGSRIWLPPWLVAVACIAVGGGATFSVLHFVILSRVPHAILGKWVVIEGELKGGTLEFRRDGTMIGKVNMKGKEGTIKATVEVEGETMRITSINPYTNRSETDVQTIRTLEDDRFVIEDRKGTTLIMERLRE